MPRQLSFTLFEVLLIKRDAQLQPPSIVFKSVVMDVATTGKNGTSPSKSKAVNQKAGAAKTKSSALSSKASPETTDAKSSPKPKSGATNAKPRAANSDSTASNDAKVPDTPQPQPESKPDAAELGKSTMCSYSLNTGFDPDLQIPSIVKRSRVSMPPERL